MDDRLRRWISYVLKELFLNSYVAVQPSESEGLSIAILEAMNFAKTVIGSNIPENIELLKNNGILFMNKSKDDLADKIEYALKHPKLIKQIGVRAQKIIASQYNWHQLVGKIIEVYQG